MILLALTAKADFNAELDLTFIENVNFPIEDVLL
jgi:hypothetical protein